MKSVFSAFLLAFAICILEAGCASTHHAPSTTPEETVSGEGTVRRGVGPECTQTWHVLTVEGVMLWPVDDKAFQVDGLRVRFTAHLAHGMTICMAGTNVEFTHLEKL